MAHFSAARVLYARFERGIGRLVASMARFYFRTLLPAILGLAWVYVAMASYRGVSAVTQGSAGTHTIEAVFFNPVMSVWYLADLPPRWQGLKIGLAAFYVYHASLAALLWNAGRGSRQLRLATVAYAFHLATTLILTLACGTGMPIPRLRTSDKTFFWHVICAMARHRFLTHYARRCVSWPAIECRRSFMKSSVITCRPRSLRAPGEAGLASAIGS
jgi:hypothetical protein